MEDYLRTVAELKRKKRELLANLGVEDVSKIRHHIETKPTREYKPARTEYNKFVSEMMYNAKKLCEQYGLSVPSQALMQFIGELWRNRHRLDEFIREFENQLREHEYQVKRFEVKKRLAQLAKSLLG